MRTAELLDSLKQQEPISLSQILDAKEQRVCCQQEMMSRETGSFPKTLISFTLNIAGAIKSFPLFTQAFVEGKRQILRELSYAGVEILEKREFCGKTGDECYLLVRESPKKIKELMVAIEEGSELGRLFDIDVMSPDIPKISRSDLGLPPRKCLVCGQKAAVCARSRAHSIEEIWARTVEIICEFLNQRLADRIARDACRALLYEVNVTPKPGLVDRNNNGSHRDMDIFTFADSACALYPYFKSCALQGLAGKENPQDLFCSLRPLGREAEEQMKQATNGVNTHKGAIFSMGIFCAAAGRMADRSASKKEFSSLCAQMCRHLMDDFKGIGKKETLSYGEKLYKEYGITGIRGEAAQGFPSVFEIGLPKLKEEISQGKSMNDAGVSVLIALISKVQDTNIITRSDRETLLWAQKEAQQVLKNGVKEEEVKLLDQLFIEKNISPGGCADLLALCFFVYFCHQEKEDT